MAMSPMERDTARPPGYTRMGPTGVVRPGTQHHRDCSDKQGGEPTFTKPLQPSPNNRRTGMYNNFCRTVPPRPSTRDRSRGTLGLWSLVSAMTPRWRHNTARQSPTLEAYTCAPVPAEQHTQGEVTMAGEQCLCTPVAAQGALMAYRVTNNENNDSACACHARWQTGARPITIVRLEALIGILNGGWPVVATGGGGGKDTQQQQQQQQEQALGQQGLGAQPQNASPGISPIARKGLEAT